MLLQNPQLAYALLQAQVVMKIIDPHTAAVSLFIAEKTIGIHGKHGSPTKLWCF